MVIDKGKLIALLVDKTGKSKEEIEQQLDELIVRIREAVQSNRQFHIEDFGTFSILDDSIHFEPSSQLKTEINQKYAGMKPIELMEAFKETGAGVPVEQKSTDVAAPELPSETEEPPLKETQVVDEQISGQPEEHKKTEEEPDTPPIPVSEELATVEDTSSEPPSPQLKEGAKKTKTSKQRKAFQYGNKRNESSKAGIIALVAIIAIVILLGGWMLYDSGVLGTADNGYESNPKDENAIQSVPPGIAADSLQDSTATTDRMEQNAINSVSQNSTAPQQAESTPYGLKGSFNEQVENAYTIVIHSFRLKSTVQEIADSLNQEQYRTVLMDGATENGARWRLGLGQFETVPDAQRAVQTLSSPYKENHFIKRIR